MCLVLLTWQRTEETVSDGRWVSSVGHDWTHLVTSGGLLEVTGRWGPTFGHDLTDAFGRS